MLNINLFFSTIIIRLSYVLGLHHLNPNYRSRYHAFLITLRETISYDEWAGLTGYEISHMKMTCLDMSIFPDRLEYLDINDSEIKYVHIDTYRPCLSEIRASACGIFDIPGLINAPGLKLCDLRWNQLRVLDTKSIPPFTKLYVNGNELI